MLGRNSTAAPALLLAIITAACVQTIGGTNGNGQAFQLTISDPHGLVERASIRSLLPEAAGDPVQSLGDDPNGIWVTWLGSPCETRPSLEISEGEGDSISLVLSRGLLEPEVCDAMATGYGVVLILKQPVQAADVVFSISDGQAP